MYKEINFKEIPIPNSVLNNIIADFILHKSAMPRLAFVILLAG